MKSLRTTLILIVVILFFQVSTGLCGQDSMQQKSQEPLESIFENRTVTNIQFPVRVFLEGQPVEGLSKEDFTLFVDGKETPINGFYEIRKKLNSPSDLSTGQGRVDGLPPRLFVFIFNRFWAGRL